MLRTALGSQITRSSTLRVACKTRIFDIIVKFGVPQMPIWPIDVIVRARRLRFETWESSADSRTKE